MEKPSPRFTLKTLLVIMLVVAAYFAGRNARIDEYETELEIRTLLRDGFPKEIERRKSTEPEFLDPYFPRDGDRLLTRDHYGPLHD